MNADRYEVFPSWTLRGKRWRYRLVAANNEQVGRDSQSYATHSRAVRAAEQHQQVSSNAAIVDAPS